MAPTLGFFLVTCILILYALYKQFDQLLEQRSFTAAIHRAVMSPKGFTTASGFAAIHALNAGKKCDHPSCYMDTHTFHAICSYCGKDLENEKE
jgi:uncharacterized Zn-finger protein